MGSVCALWLVRRGGVRIAVSAANIGCWIFGRAVRVLETALGLGRGALLVEPEFFRTVFRLAGESVPKYQCAERGGASRKIFERLLFWPLWSAGGDNYSGGAVCDQFVVSDEFPPGGMAPADVGTHRQTGR